MGPLLVQGPYNLTATRQANLLPSIAVSAMSTSLLIVSTVERPLRNLYYKSERAPLVLAHASSRSSLTVFFPKCQENKCYDEAMVVMGMTAYEIVIVYKYLYM